MLSPVVREISRRGPVSVLARGRRGLEGVAGDRVFPLAVDYTDGAALDAVLDAAVAARGAFDLCVAWIHATAPSAPLAVARRVEGAFFHVLGSAAAGPSRPDDGRRAAFEAAGALTYHEVVLGFVRGPSGSRWLTDAEIAAGVLGAVASAPGRTVVGDVRPWSERPR